MINVDKEFPIGEIDNEVFSHEILLILKNVFNQYVQIYSYIRKNNEMLKISYT